MAVLESQTMEPYSIVSLILALQFAAFGWRINREIKVGDEGRKTWFPIADWINVLSMIATAFWGFIIPLATHRFGHWSNIVVAVAGILIVLHPISMACHYRLPSKEGRAIYIRSRGDYPYATGREIVWLVITIVAATGVAWFVGTR